MRPLHISGVDDMSGTEFEHFIAKLLRKQGYQVQEIGGFEDYGIDLIASRGEQKYAVQAKRWSSEVGVDAVRAAVTGVKYHGCTKAVVITNNYFSQRAIALADVNDCKLINRDELASEIRKAA
ncbi:MAG: restriction endonuclease [Anaerolineales bacterium]